MVHHMTTSADGGPTHLPCPLGKDLLLHFRKDTDTCGRVEMLLEIGEHTSESTIRLHWKEIDQWRGWLLTWQGPWCIGGRGGLFYRLHVDNTLGQSYDRLAKRLNKTVAVELATCIEDERALQQAVKAGEIRETSTLLDTLERQHKTGH
jgi:hypothetical protein